MMATAAQTVIVEGTEVTVVLVNGRLHRILEVRGTAICLGVAYDSGVRTWTDTSRIQVFEDGRLPRVTGA